MPLRTVPAGTDDLIFSFLLEGDFSASGSIPGIEPAEKGCAADVDVAAGVSFGRALVAVVVFAVTVCAAGVVDWLKDREADPTNLRRAESRRRQRRQIILSDRLLRAVQSKIGREFQWSERSCMSRRCQRRSPNHNEPLCSRSNVLNPQGHSSIFVTGKDHALSIRARQVKSKN